MDSDVNIKTDNSTYLNELSGEVESVFANWPVI
jgi:hypothetical protein